MVVPNDSRPFFPSVPHARLMPQLDIGLPLTCHLYLHSNRENGEPLSKGEIKRREKEKLKEEKRLIREKKDEEEKLARDALDVVS